MANEWVWILGAITGFIVVRIIMKIVKQEFKELKTNNDKTKDVLDEQQSLEEDTEKDN